MEQEIGYKEESYKHGPNRKILQFDGLSPDGFFCDRVAMLEKFLGKFGGCLEKIAIANVDPFEKIGINALVRRTALFNIPENQSLKLVDYSKVATVDCFPTGTDYRGKIVINVEPNIMKEMEQLFKTIFPVNQEILKYI